MSNQQVIYETLGELLYNKILTNLSITKKANINIIKNICTNRRFNVCLCMNFAKNMITLKCSNMLLNDILLLFFKAFCDHMIELVYQQALEKVDYLIRNLRLMLNDEDICGRFIMLYMRKEDFKLAEITKSIRKILTDVFLYYEFSTYSGEGFYHMEDITVIEKYDEKECEFNIEGYSYGKNVFDSRFVKITIIKI